MTDSPTPLNNAKQEDIRRLFSDVADISKTANETHALVGRLDERWTAMQSTIDRVDRNQNKMDEHTAERFDETHERIRRHKIDAQTFARTEVAESERRTAVAIKDAEQRRIVEAAALRTVIEDNTKAVADFQTAMSEIRGGRKALHAIWIVAATLCSALVGAFAMYQKLT